jgi:hypothetical protein
MSDTYIPADVRRMVVDRAARACEYCLLAGEDYPNTFHVDHVIGEKHGGPTEPCNLALSCPECNTAKGSDIATINWPTSDVIRLFNPRHDDWREHFALAGAVIEGLTDIGRGTVRLLQFNDPDRVELREALVAGGRYPSPEAFRRLTAPSA